MMYILSVSLQVAGALILLLWACGNTKERIKDKYYPEIRTAERDKDENITMDVKIIRKCASAIYMNRFSFLYIALGYYVAVFGNVGDRKTVIAVSVLGVTIVLMIFAVTLSNILALIIYRKDWKINIDELNNDVMTPMTNKEIDEICK